MSPALQVDKDEWEAFRSEFSKLTKNYELVLGKLEQAEVKIRMLNEENDVLRREGAVPLPANSGSVERAKSEREEVRKPGLDSSIKPESGAKPGDGFWASLRGRLSGLRRGQRYPSVYCRKCNYPIRETSRFCSGCGADFGALICPCGRDLLHGGKYCDWCGRRAELR